MDKIEKVIQAFENCMAPEMNDDETCVDCIRAGECPWDDCQERDSKLIDIPLSLAMAALEALKAQEQNEPRVLTREEVESINHDVVCEFRYGIELSAHTIESVKSWLNGVRYAYGKTWRCWSARPTDEQREDVPWAE